MRCTSDGDAETLSYLARYRLSSRYTLKPLSWQQISFISQSQNHLESEAVRKKQYATMEGGLGLALGIPGLIQTCVHGYRFVCVMIDLDKTAAVMRLRYRIEESRMILWGRFWGLLDPEDYTKIKDGTQNFDDLLEIPGIKALVNDILKQVLVSLEEVQKLSRKYSAVEPQVPTTNGAPVKAKPESKLSAISKLKWGIKDKASFEATLASLTSLNDGLEQLLPRSQRTALEQALVGEVLAEERIKPGDGESKKLAAAFEGKDVEVQDEPPRKTEQDQQAQMISHLSIRDHSFDDYDKATGSEPDEFDDVEEDEQGVEDQEEEKIDESSPAASMQLPMEWFVNMVGKGDGFSMESIRLPPGFEPGVRYKKEPSDNEHLADENTNNVADFIEETVFVEWRNYDNSALDAQLQMALDVRREEVSRFFRRKGKDNDHSVMQCLGFVQPEKSKMGLVFRPPADQPGPPISLYDMMRVDFESPNTIVPDLEERLALARKLSTALYQLQCSGWLHRQISSHNVVFFPTLTEKGQITFSLSHPKLVGWQTARYDDQVFHQHSEGTSVWRKNEWKPMVLPYIHPSRPAARTRFKRSFDVYSLGIVLAEIAFWEPIDVLGGEGYQAMFSHVDQSSDAPELQQFSEVVISTCKTELAGEVGRRYQSAVVWALEGVKSWHAQQAAARYEASEDELNKEIGLEKALFWNVLDQLSNPFGAQV
jgi:hypothetical protein